MADLCSAPPYFLLQIWHKLVGHEKKIKLLWVLWIHTLLSAYDHLFGAFYHNSKIISPETNGKITQKSQQLTIMETTHPISILGGNN